VPVAGVHWGAAPGTQPCSMASKLEGRHTVAHCWYKEHLEL